MFFTHQPPWLLRRAFPPLILAPEVLKVDALICESLIFPDSIPSAALQPVEVDWKTTTKKLVFTFYQQLRFSAKSCVAIARKHGLLAR